MIDEQEFLDENDLGMWAQLAFLQVAASGVVYTGLSLFRYQSGDAYYASGDLISMNWWKLANQIMLYGAFGLFSVGYVTQLLDLFGIATSFNFFWWGTINAFLGTAVSLFANAMLFWAYDRNYACSMDSGDSNQASCASFGPTLEF